MKLGRILRDSLEGAVPRLVVVQPERECVIDLATAEYQRLRHSGASEEAARRLARALYPPSMSGAIAAGPTFLTAAAHTAATSVEDGSALLPFEQVRWLAPLDPPVMRDCLAFEQHLRNTFKGDVVPPQALAQHYQMPLYYKGNPLTLIGHEQEVPWPGYAQKMDYELELGFVIGGAGKDLRPEQAKGYLFGVTIFNDFSARDIQLQEMMGLLGPAKGKDFATALGPWITTVDELDVHHLTMVARVNGEEWSRGSSAAMMWQVEEIIAYVAKGEGILAGELIGSGTIGFGCGLELGKLLRPGDVVELEVEGIGVLRNRVGVPAPAGWLPAGCRSAAQSRRYRLLSECHQSAFGIIGCGSFFCMAGASPTTTMRRLGKPTHASHSSGTPCGCHAPAMLAIPRLMQKNEPHPESSQSCTAGKKYDILEMMRSASHL